uniref:Thioredoxin domain-containing protein n=1 Tax=Haptolina brevifila TaxID=156173 RepID=A0A7S2JMK3_9EUKA|eukprot:CAMPEP_0174711614 /NCGR_PEP_ID=MMETSP1094-20130205/12884_1 /TAXON_ID=156173 /ORGANISM="Chrysochromulina brevifilum, Strain UTEX LB 985" /LENGTH=160 /DNA_ID=CAMNT_0015910577 /DNA_START=79 /DNA_END=561 /DNA_ORIENTATION=-
MAAPSPPPAVDLRFAGRSKPDESAKYGKDPRSETIAAKIDFKTVATGKVGTLSSIEELQASLDVADKNQQVVVLKFMRKDCMACASTKKQFESTARSYAAGGQFYEVDFDVSRAFCRSCALKFVPSAHIYVANELRAALPMGKKSWDAFVEKLSAFKAEL